MGLWTAKIAVMNSTAQEHVIKTHFAYNLFLFSHLSGLFGPKKSIWTIKPHGFQYKHIHIEHTCTVTLSESHMFL